MWQRKPPQRCATWLSRSRRRTASRSYCCFNQYHPAMDGVELDLTCQCGHENFHRVVVQRKPAPPIVTDFVACVGCRGDVFRPAPSGGPAPGVCRPNGVDWRPRSSAGNRRVAQARRGSGREALSETWKAGQGLMSPLALARYAGRAFHRNEHDSMGAKRVQGDVATVPIRRRRVGAGWFLRRRRPGDRE